MANDFTALAERFRDAARSTDPESCASFVEVAAGQAIKRNITADTCFQCASGAWFSLGIAPVLADDLPWHGVGIDAAKWVEIWRSAAHELQTRNGNAIPPLSEIQTPTWFDQPINWRLRSEQNAVVCDWLAKNLINGDAEPIKQTDGLPECHVTLLQMAGIVNRTKRTLERLSTKATFPPPDVQGSGGKPNEWRWSIVRPVLEAEYDRKLPEVFPADRFQRSN